MGRIIPRASQFASAWPLMKTLYKEIYNIGRYILVQGREFVKNHS